ncbi:TPA: hypothetical protein N0F65_003234 [Lagenidium giganteum]|uniref:Uncharacterized protein n=1 Tax=Lagenidium giganteum TaxID=4803 RepID=A0AAV2Z9R1_9STRA|nr:TPA: hypothetical protein N0F65_003234 [Lagenidium giganteum]
MARLLYVLSPAKTLDMALAKTKACTQPTMMSDAHDLVQQLQKLTQAKLKALLGVSDALAKLNYDRYQSFDFTTAKSPSSEHKQAALAFNGPAYLGLAAAELSDSDLQYTQGHLRILCGLYGMLRPLDLIQAYRLEMGQKFANSRGKDLYAFWGDSLAKELNAQLAEDAAKGEAKVLVNVASQEYFKSIDLAALDEDVQVIDCVFKDDNKIKSVYAKRARGLMCRYLIQNQIDSIDGIKAFDLEGYVFDAKQSDDTSFVFNRSAKAAKEAVEAMRAKAAAAKASKAVAKDEDPEPVIKQSSDGESVNDTQLVRRSTRKRRKAI